MPRLLKPLCAASILASHAAAQPWRDLEAPLLTNHVQLTSDTDFVKAGEAYFSPDGRHVIFQAVPVPPAGQQPSPHYSMFLAEVTYTPSGDITRLANITRLSPEGAAATCGNFHPTDALAIFGCTMTPPADQSAPGYQRSGSRYAWSFPTEMEVCALPFPESDATAHPRDWSSLAYPVFSRPGYDAECSFSPDGRFILYANVDPSKGDKPDADLWVYDTQTNTHTPLITAEGYDGGPFFSSDGTKICYRSDRKGNDLLQLFIATLKRDASGAITGIEREIPLTDNNDVNWAPFWHPSASFLIYTASHVGHHNYEVFSIALDDELTQPPAQRARRRITFAPGFDGLPAFNADGSWMIWTSQRTTDSAPGSSQLWAAKVSTDPAAWTAPLTREQAISLATEYLRAETLDAEIVDAKRTGRRWHVSTGILENAPPITVIVDDLGVVAQEQRSGA